MFVKPSTTPDPNSYALLSGQQRVNAFWADRTCEGSRVCRSLRHGCLGRGRPRFRKDVAQRQAGCHSMKMVMSTWFPIENPKSDNWGLP